LVSKTLNNVDERHVYPDISCLEKKITQGYPQVSKTFHKPSPHVVNGVKVLNGKIPPTTFYGPVFSH